MRRLRRWARHAVSLPGVFAILLSASAEGQIPRITTLFPIGGQTGTTVEVEVRGANLNGADRLLVTGAGVTGTIEPSVAKPDERYRSIWQARCASCHELRSPANRSLTPAQWAATVERMVKVRQAPLSADEADKVTQYLVGAARAGRVTAHLTIQPNTPHGTYEVRVVTPRGVSTACPFDVGALPDVMAANGTREQAQPIAPPCVVDGCFAANGERHFFKFAVQRNQRLVFNLKGFRYNEANQLFFNPDLRLYDATGRELVENHGYYDLDPLIDWTCPVDGEYTIEVRDLLGRGNPGSVYRLTIGNLPYDPVSSSSASTLPQVALVCVARPDNVTLRPGLTTAVEITILRREKLEGDIVVTAENLPPGVTATPAIIPPDRDKGWLLLTAAADASVVAQPFRITAVGRGAVGEVRTQAIPQETYLLNNAPHTVDRRESVVAVCGEADFTAAFTSPGPITVDPKRSADIRVKIVRRVGFKGPVTVVLNGLPTGWVASPETATPDASEVTLQVRPDGNNPAPFLNRDSKRSPIVAVLEASTDEFRFVFGTAVVVK